MIFDYQYYLSPNFQVELYNYFKLFVSSMTFSNNIIAYSAAFK